MNAFYWIIINPFYHGGFYFKASVLLEAPYQSKVIKNLDEFKKISDIIIAYRLSNELKDVREKVYTRDLFNKD